MIDQLENDILNDDFDEYTLMRYKKLIQQHQIKKDIKKIQDAHCNQCNFKEFCDSNEATAPKNLDCKDLIEIQQLLEN